MWELLLSCRVGPWTQTQVVRLGSECLVVDEPSQQSSFPLSAAGLDWSEESGEEPEDSDQASPYQIAWSIRETLRYERHT